MSGHKIEGMTYSSFEREELARKLENEGEHEAARKVERGDCLGFSERFRAQDALSRAGLSEHFDYREVRCYDDDEEEPY